MKKVFLEDALIYSAIRAIGAISNVLSPRAALGLASCAAGFHGKVAKRRKIAVRNLRAAFSGELSASEIDGIVMRNFKNLYMNAVELLRAPRMTPDYFDSHVRVEGEEVIRRCLTEGNGVILLTAHYGNWELLNIAAGMKGYPMTVFARPQKHPRSDAYLNALRASKGAQVVYKGVSARHILRALRQGRIVGMLADQDAGRNGVFVPFFGRLSSCPRGVTRFAKKSGAPIIPVFDTREPGGHHVIACGEPLRVDEALADDDAEAQIMREFHTILESRVRRNPDQWLWPHRRWKSSPDRVCVVLNDGRTGHLKQSEAFFENIVRCRIDAGFAPEATRMRVIDVRYRSEAAKKALIVLGMLTRGHLPFARALLSAALLPESSRAIRSAYADYVISCGSGSELVNLVISAENGAKSCLIHKPQFGADRYTVVVVPRHDAGTEGANVFQTVGAVTSTARSTAHGVLRPRQSLKTAGFLVGGPSQRSVWNAASFEEACAALGQACRAGTFELAVTSSRRTPVESEETLSKYFEGVSRELVVVRKHNPPGAYRRILETSDALIVTADSVSMISEALAVEKPVIALLPGRDGFLDRKLGAFINNFQKSGRLTACLAPEIVPALRRALDAAPQNGTIDFDADVLRRAAAALVDRAS